MDQFQRRGRGQRLLPIPSCEIACGQTQDGAQRLPGRLGDGLAVGVLPTKVITQQAEEPRARVRNRLAQVELDVSQIAPLQLGDLSFRRR